MDSHEHHHHQHVHAPAPAARPVGFSRRQLLIAGALAPLAFAAARAERLFAAPNAMNDAARAAGVDPSLIRAFLQAAGTEQRIVHSVNPPLLESPLWKLDGLITPNSLHFVRNHFPTPQIDVNTWRLTVDGEVEQELSLSFDDIRALPSVTRTVTLECSGNGRGRFSPPASGTPWTDGAVGTAVYTGVPLAHVLRMAGVKPSTVDVLTVGGDAGRVERALPVGVALGDDVILAYTMNGEPLPADHGYPLRLVVPNWVGIASIKWIDHIRPLPDEYRGLYQGTRYILEGPDYPDSPLLTILPLKSAIARPMIAGQIEPGETLISGYAWSGAAEVVRVEVSIDGSEWMEAEIQQPVDKIHWVRWQLPWTAEPGQHVLLSRATDASGRVQPDTVPWNRQGYAYNAPFPHLVGVGEPAEIPEGFPLPPAPPAVAAPPPPEVAAISGDAVYARSCAGCHGREGQGTARASALIGSQSNVPNYTEEQLFQYVKNAMPFNRPGSLSDEEYAAVTEFLRRANNL